jgi:hypothetical protein
MPLSQRLSHPPRNSHVPPSHNHARAPAPRSSSPSLAPCLDASLSCKLHIVFGADVACRMQRKEHVAKKHEYVCGRVMRTTRFGYGQAFPKRVSRNARRARLERGQPRGGIWMMRMGDAPSQLHRPPSPSPVSKPSTCGITGADATHSICELSCCSRSAWRKSRSLTKGTFVWLIQVCSASIAATDPVCLVFPCQGLRSGP